MHPCEAAGEHMTNIEDIANDIQIIKDGTTPELAIEATEALSVAIGSLSGMLEGVAGDEIICRLEEGRTLLAAAADNLARVQGHLDIYLAAILGGPGPEPSPPPEPSATPGLQAILDNRTEHERHEAFMHDYKAAFREAVQDVSHTLDTEVLPDWTAARGTLIEFLSSSPPDLIDVRHIANYQKYQITARWTYRHGDFNDQSAPTTEVEATVAIGEDEIGSLMEALAYVKSPKNYRLPKRRGPYGVPTIWDENLGRFKYPEFVLWANISEQIAASAQKIGLRDGLTGAWGTAIENTIDLDTAAEEIRRLAQGEDPHGSHTKVISRMFKEGPRGENADASADGRSAAAYMQRRYIDSKRQEIEWSRRAAHLIITAQPVSMWRDIKIVHVNDYYL